MSINTKSSTLRLLLYIGVSFITAIQAVLTNLTVETMQAFTPFEWVNLLISVVVPPLITLRAYIDQSPITHAGEPFLLHNPNRVEDDGFDEQ